MFYTFLYFLTSDKAYLNPPWASLSQNTISPSSEEERQRLELPWPKAKVSRENKKGKQRLLHVLSFVGRQR